ncbi:MAG: pyridoxal-phosphate dependent enzyme [Nitrospirae bacterium]|nr:MAG: pyridoxal-phosphate dependent enzyme [Nitrospirota bacterium]
MIFAKLEYNNLTSSVKDRAALNMIIKGEETGELTKDKIILESTSGNTGISLAAIGMLKGYKVKLVLPETISLERRNILKEFGAELMFTSASEGSDGAYKYAKRLYKKHQDIYFTPNQYSNPANPEAHYKGTADEIWKQTGGKVTHFVAATGTSGTLMGCSRRLKELNHNIQSYAAEPKEEIHGVEGLKNMRVEMVPDIYDETLVDHKLYITTEDAYNMALRLAKEERLFVGPSSGLNICAALKVAESIEKGVVLTVLPDTGYRYISTGIFNRELFDIFIAHKEMDKIKEHARDGYPFEVCGLMAGSIRDSKKIVTKVFPCENINKDRAIDRFEIHPREYLKITKQLSRGESIIGIYHSHPNHPSRPSITDLSFASPVYSYLIVATIKDRISSIRCWTLNEEEDGFKEEFIMPY